MSHRQTFLRSVLTSGLILLLAASIGLLYTRFVHSVVRNNPSMVLLGRLGHKPATVQYLLQGTYKVQAMGLLDRITLKANNMYIHEIKGCSGTREVETGVWKMNEGQLVLLTSPGDLASRGESVCTRMIPVCWNQILYLVNVKSAPGFFASMRNGGEMPGLDYVRFLAPAEITNIAGSFGTPPQYADFVINGPIIARVTKILPGGEVNIRSMSDCRIHVGTFLRGLGANQADTEIEVVDVTSCVVKCRISYAPPHPVQIRVGEQFTSGDQIVRVRYSNAH